MYFYFVINKSRFDSKLNLDILEYVRIHFHHDRSVYKIEQ